MDDEPTILLLLANILEEQGIAVTTATDGEEAMEQVRRNPPNLILLDIFMPRRDGLQVVADLRADRALKDIPVVLISANPNLQDLPAAQYVQGFLVKPFDLDELLSVIQRALSCRPRPEGPPTGSIAS
ncbi:MAG: response regulator [Bacillota bacterium]